MRVKQSFMTPHCETTGKNIKKCKIQESSKAKCTDVKVKSQKKNQIKNVASLTGNSLVLPREMIIWSC